MKNRVFYITISALLTFCLAYGIKLNREINNSIEEAHKVFDKVDKLKSETEELSKKVDELPENFIFIVPAEESKKENEEYLREDIPLSEELQKYTYSVCKSKEVSYEMVLAMIEKESNYDETAVSETGDYGLMQININAQNMTKEEALKPEKNIEKGVEIISKLMDKYKEPNIALMAYNCGESGAEKLWNNGIYSTKYSLEIMQKAEELKSK